uniref:Choline transporter-like protein n=1 Tax=Odontella aurita TaxID=265563 RepID=A0A7S4HIL7_9STRA|mmetsp:Transcript_10580/g.31200  ORF Transcript_10580/g.31200 Transcript_10580/m.31200 type:complete len:756 (+) Transcript_10580:1190-3457(+)
MSQNDKSTLLRASPTVIPVSRDPDESALTTIQLSPLYSKPRVPREDTIPPEVRWHPQDRKRTDKCWANTFFFAYATFLGTCIFIFSKAQPKYQRANDGSGRRVISNHFHNDVSTCCNEVAEGGHFMAQTWGLCSKLDDSPIGGRRLAIGGPKFDGDEGMFDAFLEAPLIIVGCVAAVALFALVWLVLLRKYSTQIVFGTEIMKVFLLLCFALFAGGGSVSFLSMILAIGLGSFAYSRKNDLLQAARIISHSAVALRGNPRMIAGLVGIKLLYILQACLFIGAFTASFEIVEVVAQYLPRNRCPMGDFEASNTTRSESYCYTQFSMESPGVKCFGTNCLSDDPLPQGEVEGSCVYEYPPYVRTMTQLQALLWLWSILLVDKVRLAFVGCMVGSWHFHRNDNDGKPSVSVAIKTAFTKSIGTLAFAATITGVIDRFRRKQTNVACCWWMWIGPQCIFLLPFQAFLCIYGTCIAEALQLFTKFSVLLHVFTGLPLEEAGKKCKAIMNRHYKGGFITEYSSKSVLMAGSYLFSITVGFIAWGWVDAAFDCTTFADATGQEDSEQFQFWLLLVWAYFFFIICTYPIAGVLVIMMLNSFMQRVESRRYRKGAATTQDSWVPPLAGVFVSCVCMLLFRFMARIILDAVDTMFLCFAIDQDNGVDGRGKDDFGTIIKAMPEYAVASPIESIDPEQPIVSGVIERDLPPEADIVIDEGGSDIDGHHSNSKTQNAKKSDNMKANAKMAGYDPDEEQATVKQSAKN